MSLIDTPRAETTTDPVVAVYPDHAQAEAAIRALSHAGFDMTKLSIIGKGYHSEEHPVGFYSTGDRIRSWGGLGSFWGAIWGLLTGPSVILLPQIGIVAVAGPIGLALVAALEGAVVVGSLSALGGALASAGLPKDLAIKYEADVKADRYVLMVHGSTADVTQAQAVLAALPAPAAAA